MEISRDDFRRHFELLSDAALLETRRDDLVAAARGCYDDEVARRGLNAPAPAEAAVGPAEGSAPEGGDLVLIATYSLAEEASLARGLLQSAEIPVLVENELIPLGGYQIRLLVPADFEEQAHEILAMEISDEDLAAQAEAAGMAAEEEGQDPQS